MMKINVADLKSECPKTTGSFKIRKPAWYKATAADKRDYTALLGEKLADLVPPDTLNCSDVNC